MLQEEFKRLKSVDRPGIVKEIEEARSHGDISENAEYHAAKERQALLEGRIRLLEDKLARAQIIDGTGQSTDRVSFGTTVVLENTESGEEVTYTIVGEDEADLKSGLISVTSPVARALMGKEPGSAVQVRAPKGIRGFEILEIHLGLE
jgi:transcription elongation factor GreA